MSTILGIILTLYRVTYQESQCLKNQFFFPKPVSKLRRIKALSSWFNLNSNLWGYICVINELDRYGETEIIYVCGDCHLKLVIIQKTNILKLLIIGSSNYGYISGGGCFMSFSRLDNVMAFME